jgi:hypothetical protein
MTAPERFAESQFLSCTAGAVHTWFSVHTGVLGKRHDPRRVFVGGAHVREPLVIAKKITGTSWNA